MDMIRSGLESRALEKGRVVAASLFRLPFQDRSLVSCACLRFLHHLPDRAQRVAALSELARVARGPLVVSLWTGVNYQSLRGRVKRLLGRRPSQRHALPLRAFREEAERAGLSVKRIRFLFRFVSETAYVRLERLEAPARGSG